MTSINKRWQTDQFQYSFGKIKQSNNTIHQIKMPPLMTEICSVNIENFLVIRENKHGRKYSHCAKNEVFH